MEFCEPELVGMSSPRLNRLIPLVQSYIESGRVPGMVLSIARRGKEVFSGAWGVDDIARGSAMRKDLIFRLASQTKTITMAAALMLYEDGLFQYSDPIEKYLPEFAGMKVCTGSQDGHLQLVDAERSITIEDLCMHQAGIVPMTDAYPLDEGLEKTYLEAFVDYARYNLAEWVSKMASLPLCCQPGSTWYYGSSHEVIARLVEVLAGMPYADFLQQRIFNPLGMPDTGYWLPGEKLNRLARGYVLNDKGEKIDMGEGERSNWSKPPRLTAGGYGIASTATDYQRFAQMLANGGQLDGVRLLSRKSIEFLALNRTRPDQMPFTPFPGSPMHGMGFALGVSTVTDPAALGIPCSAGCFGWGGYFNTGPWIDPAEQLSGVMMVQVGPPVVFWPHTPPLELRRIVYQAIND